MLIYAPYIGGLVMVGDRTCGLDGLLIGELAPSICIACLYIIVLYCKFSPSHIERSLACTRGFSLLRGSIAIMIEY